MMNTEFKNCNCVGGYKDATLAVFDMINSCNDGDTLHLGGGEMHFFPDMAFIKEYYISNNDYSLKSIAFPIINKKNVTIDGDGCRLIFHGNIMPFVIDNCENITVKNISVDYDEPMYFEAEIIDSSEKFVDMKFNSKFFHCDIADNKFVFYGNGWKKVTDKVLSLEFNPDTKRPDPYAPTYFVSLSKDKNTGFMSELYRYLSVSKIGDNIIRLEGDINYKHKIGNRWVCIHNDRTLPGMFVTESRNVCIENINMFHARSMGIICQLAENITLDNVKMVPSEGRILSVTADATHFVNCSGTINIRNCVFESMMDDACNVHGIYMPVDKKINDTKVLLRFGHHQQYGINIFKKGDVIQFVDNETMAIYGNLTVKSSTLVSGKFLMLETEEKLPSDMKVGHIIENGTRMPYVHFKNCRCGYNRPRGFLITTCKGALVEGCTFYNMCEAISMNGDADSWFESGPCNNIIIKNNNFDNAAYAGSYAIVCNPPKSRDNVYYHHNILVENNVFRMHEKRIAYLSNSSDITFKNNSFIEDKSLPSHSDVQCEGGFCVKNCKGFSNDNSI